MSGYIGANTSVTQVDGFRRSETYSRDEANLAIFDIPYVTYGGTADAITITTGANLTSLITGMKVRLRATATNTGVMTANIDGIGAVTVKTITGADTPAGYIRTDVDTDFHYDGTNLIADRQPEYGTNSNGEFWRRADGVQECWLNPSAAEDSISRTWTFPAAFVGNPACTHSACRFIEGGVGEGYGYITQPSNSPVTSTGFTFSAVKVSGFGVNIRFYSLRATGKWY